MAGRDVNVQMGLTSVDEVSFMMLPGKVTENGVKIEIQRNRRRHFC